MHLLSIDFGTKRLGLAWADTTLGVILPYGLVEEDAMPAKAKAVAKLVNEEHIDQIVMGYPLNLQGKENTNTERVQKFVFELQKYTAVPVEYSDERFSSQQADAVGDGVSRDERSAMVILEGYLSKRKS